MMGSGTSDLRELRFDDLTAPVLTDIQRQILDYTESRHVTFDLDAMLAEAVTAAGADDLADDDGFADRLAAHVAAIESDTGLRQLSRTSCGKGGSQAAQPVVADRSAQALSRDRRRSRSSGR